MKRSEIKVGGLYSAKVSGKLVTVRVDVIRESASYRAGRPNSPTMLYDVINLSTGRKTTFRSAAKFRSAVNGTVVEERLGRQNTYCIEHQPKQVGKVLSEAENPFRQHEDEKRPDPTSVTAQTAAAPSTVSTSPKPGYRADGSKGLLASDAIARGERFAGGSVMTAPQVIPNLGIPMSAIKSPTDKMIPNKDGLGALLGAKLAAPKPVLAPHVIVIARAGTGKTTTLLEGLKKLLSYGSCPLIPSVQQEAIWNVLLLSNHPQTVLFAAFSNVIATELKNRIPRVRGCDARTLHSHGNYAVNKAFKLTGEPNDGRVPEIIAELMEVDLRLLMKARPLLVKATRQLVGLCKQCLTPLGGVGEEANLENLISHYDVEMGNEKDRNDTFDLVPRVLERCKDVNRDGYIDFNDMIWLPIVLNLPVFQNDIVFIDEAQDLNRCQQALAMRAGRRLILCGDPKQSIFGFAGADTDSMPRMEKLLADGRGCITLPLTVTRRCGKAIVKEAQAIVPDIEAHPSNPGGAIEYAKYPIQRRYKGGYGSTGGGKWEEYELPYPQTYLPMVQDGDMVLCRANAPLVNQCFRFLKRGQKATIQGRNVADSLLELVDRVGGTTTAEFLRNLHDWYASEVAKENARRVPSDTKLEGIADRRDCLMCFVDQTPQRSTELLGIAVTPPTADVVKQKIREIFTDNGHATGIRLSSIHRAKGLEADRVFYIQGFGRPDDKIKTQWERDQEQNLRYVAITRAKSLLVYVTSEDGGDRDYQRQDNV